MNSIERLSEIARLVRHDILVVTSRAGSGHPTSSLSAVDLMVGLLFGGGFRYDVDRPEHPNNDRLVFSKGHASPLLYALWSAAGALRRDALFSYRSFGSPLEGHPTPRFPYVDAATGSLGQGLSVGLGLALNARFLDRLPYRTFVLLGDSEMAEGSQWEALQIAAHYELDNLIGILDVNRLGQRGETLYGHDLDAYERRVSAFGWETILIDGHSFTEITEACRRALEVLGRPAMIIAKTLKGKGVSFIEDRDGWHGKALGKEDLDRALKELGPVDTSVRGVPAPPDDLAPEAVAGGNPEEMSYSKDAPVATRTAFGNALARLYPRYPDIVCLDAEVSNSTKTAVFKERRPERFFEMYVAEQNMVGVALGLASRHKIPFVSTFAAFFTRAFDQIRMSRYSDARIAFVGSHAGVSIGPDGPSQMGLEDLAMFRTLPGAAVLYPADPVSTERLVEEAARWEGISYLRTTRGKTPVIYDPGEDFPVGGSKILRQSGNDAATVVAAGITLHEALAAADRLAEEGIAVRVIDLYSVKPVDRDTLRRAAEETRALVTVEDHYAEGGLGEAVAAAVPGARLHILAVRKTPRSGRPEELLDDQDISRGAIVETVKAIVARPGDDEESEESV
ncbi:MAG: transketolase [Deltaproteobacteria bacterium]|nr:transketolase [Deltaproteobacteria bacterium]